MTKFSSKKLYGEGETRNEIGTIYKENDFFGSTRVVGRGGIYATSYGLMVIILRAK